MKNLNESATQKMTIDEKENYFWTRVIIDGENQMIEEYLAKTKSHLMDDLTYVSLAMIQKADLSNLESKYHRHEFDLEFVKNLQNLQIKMKTKYENKKSYSGLTTALTQAYSRSKKF